MFEINVNLTWVVYYADVLQSAGEIILFNAIKLAYLLSFSQNLLKKYLSNDLLQNDIFLLTFIKELKYCIIIMLPQSIMKWTYSKAIQ